MIEPITIPVPNAPATGTLTPASALKEKRTFVWKPGSTADRATLVSNNGGTNEAKLKDLYGYAEQFTLDNPVVNYRCDRTEGNSTASLTVSGDQTAAPAPDQSDATLAAQAAGDELTIPVAYSTVEKTVARVTLLPSDNVAANGTNYKTLSLVAVDAAGVAVPGGTIATFSTAATSLTSGVPFNVPLTAYRTLPAGGSLAWVTANTGTGVAIPLSLLSIEYV